MDTVDTEHDLDLSTRSLVLLFALPGAMAGLLYHALVQLVSNDGVQRVWLFSIVMLLITPLVFWLHVERRNLAQSLRFSCGLGICIASLFTWSVHRFAGVAPSATASYPWAFAILASFAIAFVLVPFRRANLEGHRFPGSRAYPSLFSHAWNQSAAGLLAAAFSGVAVLFVMAVVALFSVVGIDLSKWIDRSVVLLPVTGAAFATAIGIVRRRASILRGTRDILLALLKVLLPFQLFATAGFLTAVLVLGTKTIHTDLSVTAIILFSCGFSLSLCSAAIADRTQLPQRTLYFISCRLLALLVLPLATLAAWTLFQRVDEYAWTHDRVVAAFLVGMMLTYGLGYALAALSPSGFVRTLQSTNVASALLAVAVLALSFTPLLDGHGIGAASQLARLNAPDSQPSARDLGYLKFSSGEHGQRALAELRALAKTNPSLADALSELEQYESRRDFLQGTADAFDSQHRPALQEHIRQRMQDGSLSLLYVQNHGEADQTLIRLAESDLESGKGTDQPGPGSEMAELIRILSPVTAFELACLERALRCAALITDQSLSPDEDQLALLAIDNPAANLTLHWVRRGAGGAGWSGLHATATLGEKEPDVPPLTTVNDIPGSIDERDAFFATLARGELTTRLVERTAIVIGRHVLVPQEHQR